MDDSFCGWYFRCQSEEHTVALIPAAHTARGRRSGSLQLVSDLGSWLLRFPREDTRVEADRPCAVLGRSVFRVDGLWLDEHREGLSLEGSLRFGAPAPLRYDVMGPFRHVPLLECRHSVASMRHTVDGSLRVNDMEFTFRNGAGYLEGDRGRSFPRHYAWTQCFFEDGSLMLSVAEVPLGPLRFTGIIGVVRLREKEYRLATYLGAEAVIVGDGELVIRQGALTLTASLEEERAVSLKAPVRGVLARTVRESVACRARYRFRDGSRLLLSLDADNAAFEFSYPADGDAP